MKYSLALAAALIGSEVAAFPAIADSVARGEFDVEVEKRQGGAPDLTKNFNPKLQHVANHGKYKFVAPDLTKDARGPCPGLNAMANHGYLPHNGVGTHADFIFGTFKAFGMGPDLSGFLTVLGGTIDGDGLSWSIGGPNAALPGVLGLGVPQGISGSHNKYEGDASPGRGDLYLNGNDFTLQQSQIQQLFDMGKANGDDITLDTMQSFRSSRFDHSVQNNKYFFNGPFTGVLVQPAAYEFIFRFMSNKSAEYPAGKLDTNVLKSFFGVTEGSGGKLTVVPGHEKFPDNWYKRAINDPYTIPFLNSDTVIAAVKYPKYLTIGGNTGKVNTLTGVDPSDLSGGVYNSKSLLQGNNLACFSSQFATQMSVDQLKCSSVITDITGTVAKLNAQFAKSFAALDCPKLSKAQTTQFNKFPGYSKLNCKTGKYPVE